METWHKITSMVGAVHTLLRVGSAVMNRHLFLTAISMTNVAVFFICVS